MQIERDTHGMLQCHPYPHEYVDVSKPCFHCAFFMGLQRKEGVRGQEGQQFDIRGTVDEFRREIMYVFWKPGMDIFVSHVRRKQLPAFVFPDGYKRSRLPRHITQQAEKTCEDAAGCWSGPSEKRLKRKSDIGTGDVKPEKPDKRVSVNTELSESVPSETCTTRCGGISQVSFSEGVRLECSTAGYVDSNAEVRLTGGQLGNEEGIVGKHGQIGETVVNDTVTLIEQTLEVRDEELLTEAADKPSPREGSLASCKVPNSVTGEMCQIGLNRDNAGMESAKTGSTRKLLNCMEGIVDADQELADPRDQPMSKENAESIFEPSFNSQKLSCEVSFRHCSGWE